MSLAVCVFLGWPFPQAARFEQDLLQMLRRNGVHSRTDFRVGTPLLLHFASAASLRRAFRWCIYTAGDSDTFAAIAEAFGVDLKDLQAWNRQGVHSGDEELAAKTKVWVLQHPTEPPLPQQRQERGRNVSSNSSNDVTLVYTVPEAGETVAVSALHVGATVEQLAFRWNDMPLDRPSTIALAGGTPLQFVRPLTYVVQPRDTLSHIAKRFSVDASDLIAWNNIREVGDFRIGNTLRLAAGGPREAKGQEGQKTWATYTVVRGDSIAAIADRFDVSLKDLAEWNSQSLAAGGELAVGTVLRLLVTLGGESGKLVQSGRSAQPDESNHSDGDSASGSSRSRGLVDG